MARKNSKDTMTLEDKIDSVVTALGWDTEEISKLRAIQRYSYGTVSKYILFSI